MSEYVAQCKIYSLSETTITNGAGIYQLDGASIYQLDATYGDA